MHQPPMTCEQVDQRELGGRYVAGQLDEAEAAAFEEHYFSCDRCWNLVKGGAAVRAALAGGAAVPVPNRSAWWRPLAIAAGLGVVLFGTWRMVGPRNPAKPDAIRGTQDSLVVQSELTDGLWRAQWPSVPEAAAYRIRVFTADGRLILTRVVSDTAVRISADSLGTLGGTGALYLEVQGFDQLRRPVARSPLTPLLFQGAPR